MRYFFTAGVLALSIFGGGAFASAAVAPVAAQSPDVTQWVQAPASSHAPTVAPKRKAAAKRPQQHHIENFASRIFARTSRIARTLTRSALHFLGTPYVFGGTTGYGFDCSGFTQHVYAMMGYRIPRTADAQFYDEHRAVGGVRAGDLVFFQTYSAGPSHVGIYLGKGQFVHASSSSGVMVSKLSDSYWSGRYIGARRVL